MVETARKSPVPVFSALADETPAKPAGKKGKQRAAEPSASKITPLTFELKCNAAQNGDVATQTMIQEFLGESMRRVYASMNDYGSLFFLVRTPVKGFDTAEKNYAVCLADFFKKTCDKVKVPKSDFEVKTKNGSSYKVSYLQCVPSQQAIVVKDGEVSVNMPLADLTDADRSFVEIALMDKQFESNQFKIEVKDGRSVEKSVEGQIINVTNDSSGSTRKARISGVTSESTPRTIKLTNKGDFPLKNLFVEYQSFAEQIVMLFPNDFPEDYRVVGLVEVPVLMPGESKELTVEIPEIITSKQQTVRIGSDDVSVDFASDLNKISKGRTKGIWVKVHRFTPYGERLEREYKSSGVPPAKWEYMAPVNVDIR
jgi:hypothetical protein